MTKSLGPTLKEEIDDLVSIGDRLSRIASTTDSALGQEHVTEASTWVGRIGQIIRQLYPISSQHGTNYDAALGTDQFFYIHSNHCRHVFIMTGVIKAVQHEFARGLLNDVRRLLQADIFADFLQMAEYLLQEGYKDPAAVVIGSVLEDALRKLAQAHGIATSSSSGKILTLEPLNQELGRAGIYDRLVQKQVTSWGELRNRAAHGQYDSYDEQQVQMMLLFVQKFCGDHLR